MASDPVAEALRPAFARAAEEARRCAADGGTGTFRVFRVFLPTAEIQIVGGDGGASPRVLSTHIAYAAGKLGDPTSIATFVGSKEILRGCPPSPGAWERLIENFEKRGPEVAAKTVRWCLLSLSSAGIPLQLVAATATEMLALEVLEG